MNYSMIVACDQNFLIGKGDKLPWKSKEDMQWFIQKTRHKAILMGATTANGIGKVLPNRLNIVLTSDPEHIQYEGVAAVTTTAQANFEALNRGFNEIVVCGGLSLYNLYIDQVEKIYFTQLDSAYEGDVKLDIPLFEDLALLDQYSENFQGWVLEEKQYIPDVGWFKTFIKVNTLGSHQ